LARAVAEALAQTSGGHCEVASGHCEVASGQSEVHGGQSEVHGGHAVQLLEIVPTKPYSYFSAGIKGVTQAMAGTIVGLETPPPASEDFDAAVILSPTWGWMSSPPVRSFVAGLPEGGGRAAVVGVTHTGGPIGSFDRLASLVEDRGYRVLERLSVFCYSRDAIAEAAPRAAAVLSGAAVQ
jgi:hypothetical protein